ncbi:histidine phosphatase family protein [Streptomyces sp. T1317-0309]|nr:histidine phosphatase family protein [Streptomyces sp. T1317-0309]
MRLLLIRLARPFQRQASWTPPAGARTDPPGPGAGGRTAAALAAEDIGALYASTLLRTQLTAAPLATHLGLDVQVRDGIRELAAGDLEMRGDHQAVETYLTTAFAWSAGDTERRMPGGESGVEALKRFDTVVAEAAATTAHTSPWSVTAPSSVCGGGRAENIDVAFASTHELRNTGVVILSGAPDRGWRVVSWADLPLGPTTAPPGQRTAEKPWTSPTTDPGRRRLTPRRPSRGPHSVAGPREHLRDGFHGHRLQAYAPKIGLPAAWEGHSRNVAAGPDDMSHQAVFTDPVRGGSPGV